MSDVRAAYDRWSRSYDIDDNLTRDLDAAVLQQAGLPLHGREVLELGCGTGKNTRWLVSQAVAVTAMDFSPGMLARASEAVPDPRVTWITADIRLPWPVADASADVVVGNLVLEHISDLAPVFASAQRVLRPGGLLYLCELHPYRQLRGGQAHFTDAATGAVVHVPAHVHSVSEYVNGGLAAGLALVQLGEWHDRDAQGRTHETAPPRLLSVLFRRE